MRILNISSLYPPNTVGGAEQGLRIMSEQMAKMGHELHVVTLSPPEWARSEKVLECNNVEVHAVPLANLYWPFSNKTSRASLPARVFWHAIDTDNRLMASRVGAIIDQVKPDVVLTRNLQGFSTAVIPAVKKRNVSLIHVLHDMSLLCPQTTMYRNNQRCGFKNERCTSCKVFTKRRWNHLESVDGVIGVSKAVLNAHIEHGLFRKIPATTIFNALKPELRIRSSVAPRNSDEPTTFGYLGRVEHSKGIETLLSAASRLASKGKAFRVLVAGRAEADYLPGLIERFPLAQVEFVGYVNPVEFFAKIDVLVFPSIAPEALGNGVFEAFSQGVPVIGSTSGGIVELIRPERDGYIFEAGNVSALEQKMKFTVDSPELVQKMSVNVLAKSDEFRASNRAAQYIEFISGVVTGSSSEKIA